MAGEIRTRPGVAIKALRQRLELTLVEVSKATGIPVSTLSRIENDLARPTYDHLLRLSQGLRVDISSLFSAIQGDTSNGRSGRRSINRLGEGLMIDGGPHLLAYLSTDLREKRFTPIIAQVKATSIDTHGPFLRHPGEEFVYVVSGTLELHSETYSPVILKTGESIYFDSSTGHAYVSTGSEPCVILSICTIPRFHDEVAASRESDRRP